MTGMRCEKGNVVEDIASDRPIDTAEDQVAIEGLEVCVLVLDGFGYRANLDVAGSRAAKGLVTCAEDFELANARLVGV